MPNLRVIVSASDLQPNGLPVAVAMGMFDGVHLGHQHVIRSALLNARRLSGRSVVISFHPHPLAMIQPEKAPEFLQSVRQRLRAIQALGVDAVLLIPFDEEFSRRTGEEFVRGLARDFGSLRSFTVGQGFHFGHGRSGNVPLLKSLGAELGFATHAMAPLSVGDQLVSSTRIRKALRAGDLSEVSELLGRSYSLAGQVVRGDQLGRQLGYPTANLDVSGLLLPPAGVYAARALRGNGSEHPCVLNIGLRPTLDQLTPTLRFEVHLLDFDDALYGEELEIEFVKRLRAEKKFPGIEVLKRQIAADIRAARSLPGMSSWRAGCGTTHTSSVEPV